MKIVKTLENGTDSANVCPQWTTQGYADSTAMGPGWVVCTEILYRIGVMATCVDLAITASASSAKIITQPWKVGNQFIVDRLSFSSAV